MTTEEIKVRGPEKASPEALARLAMITFARQVGFMERAHPSTIDCRCTLSTPYTMLFHTEIGVHITVELVRPRSDGRWVAGTVSLTQYRSLSFPIALATYSTPLVIKWDEDVPTLAMGIHKAGEEG